MELVIVWIGLAVLVGALAAGRGRSAVGWGFCALLISPLVAGIALFVSPDLNEQQEAEQKKAESHAREELIRHDAEANRREALKVIGPDVVLSLEKLRQLKEKKILNDIEFTARKQKIIFELKDKIIVDGAENFLGSLIPFFENGVLSEEEMSAVKNIVFAERPKDLAREPTAKEAEPYDPGI